MSVLHGEFARRPPSFASSAICPHSIHDASYNFAGKPRTPSNIRKLTAALIPVLQYTYAVLSGVTPIEARVLLMTSGLTKVELPGPR